MKKCYQMLTEMFSNLQGQVKNTKYRVIKVAYSPVKRFFGGKNLSGLIYMMLLVLIVVIAHFKYLLMGQPMIFFSDNITQVLPFYYHGWDLAHSGSLNLWDWTHGLGASTFSHVYYFITSPFFWISTVFPRHMMPQVFLYLYIIKLSLLAIFSFLWLTQLNKKHSISFIGAIIITFSGWVLTYYHYFFFLDAFLFYPLVLYGIERYRKEKKVLVMVGAIAMVTIINFYFSYSLIPFAMLYSLFRNVLAYRGKEIIYAQLKVIGFYLLGIGLAGIILIPSALIILQTPRLGDSDLTLTSMVTVKQLYRFVTSIFIPVGFRDNPNYLIPLSFDPGIGWSGGASLYASMLIPICVPLVLLIKDKREKIGYVLFGSILSFFLLFKVFYILFQGALETRWLYMFTFLFVMMATRVLDLYFENKNEMQSNKTRFSFIVLGLLTLAIVWGLTFITYKKQWNTSEQELIWLKNNCISSALFIVSYVTVLVANKLKYREVLLAVILISECLFSFNNLLAVDIPITKEGVEYGKVERAYFFEELEEMDDSFYRVEFNANGFSDNNLPMSSNFSGFRFYTSVFQYSQNDFLSQFKVAQWATSRVHGKENILNLLSYKYFVDFIGDANTPYGFEYFTHVQGIPVYKNKYTSELGFAFKETMSETEFNKLTPLEQNLIYPNYLIVPDEFTEQKVSDISPIDSLETLLFEAQPGEYEFKFDEVKQDVMLYLENFGSPELKVVAYLNEDIVYEEEMYQFDFAGCYINVPFNQVVVTVNSIDDGLGLLNIYLDEKLERYEPVYDARLNESLKITEFNNDELKGIIEIKGETKWLYTSIPYDKGWKVLVNNQEVIPTKVNQGFIGLQLDLGRYEIEFSFYPFGLNIGIILSIASAIILLVIRVRKGHTKKIK